MGERSDEITRDIEQTRAKLGSNLQELEHKVKGLVSPLTMTGLVFGAGILLGMVVGSRHSPPRYRQGISTSSQFRRASYTWDTIKGALIEVAAWKAHNFLQEAIPGFGEEFRKIQKREHPQLADNAPRA
jgi:hypothetical protein